MRTFLLAAAALTGSVALAVPAIAQDKASDAKLPTCSATVTDHCMQREHHAAAASHHSASRHHHRTGKHHHVRKHHAK